MANQLQIDAAIVIRSVTGKSPSVCERLAAKMDKPTLSKLVEAAKTKHGTVRVDQVVEYACGPVIAEAAKDKKAGQVYQAPKTSTRTPDEASHAVPGPVTPEINQKE